MKIFGSIVLMVGFCILLIGCVGGNAPLSRTSGGFTGSDYTYGERPFVWDSGDSTRYRISVKNTYAEYKIACGSITCLTDTGQLTIDLGNIVLAPGETREIKGAIEGSFKVRQGSENVCLGFMSVPKGLADIKGQQHVQNSKFLSRTIQAEVVSSVSCDLAVTYDPVEALTYGYTLRLDNKGQKPVICDIGIYVDGKLREEKTLSADGCKSKSVDGVIKEDKRSTHTFEAKIIKVHQTSEGRHGKKVRMRVTAYDGKCMRCCGNTNGVTANGGDSDLSGVAASDMYAFGRVCEVPGYGLAVVDDRGSRIRGNCLDVRLTSHKAAKAWGVQYLDVTWLE